MDIGSFFSKILEIDNTIPEIKDLITTKPASLNSMIELVGIFDKNPKLYNKFFKIIKIVPVNSANGKVFIIGLVGDADKINAGDDNLLVKISLKSTADRLSYEYYIGSVLNKLREQGSSQIFSVVYGKTLCKLNSSDLQPGGIMCGRSGPTVMHLIYEYIRNKNTHVVTSFSKYIKRLSPENTPEQNYMLERNIVNILIILMYNLQVANDKYDFTHYDLHLGNILVVELNEPQTVNIDYKNDKFSIVTDVMPYIIDYGRCYINPDVPELQGQQIKDYELEYGNIFYTFRQYQNALFNNDNYVVTDQERVSSMQQKIDIFLYKYLYDKRIMRDKDSLFYRDASGKNVDITDLGEDPDEGIRTQTRRLIIDSILTRNVVSQFIKKYKERKDEKGRIHYTLREYDGHRSNKPNKRYDFFKITKHVLSVLGEMMLNGVDLEYRYVWHELLVQLDVEYPFYDPKWCSLPSDYHISDYIPESKIRMGEWGHFIKSAADIGRILYNAIQDGEATEDGEGTEDEGSEGSEGSEGTEDEASEGTEGSEGSEGTEDEASEGSDYSDYSDYSDQFGGRDIRGDISLKTEKLVSNIYMKPKTPQDKKTMVNDDFVESKDRIKVTPLYVKHGDSDLVKRIKNKYKKSGVPDLPIEFIPQVVDQPIHNN